jgi:ABC-2 type transport system permease protein
MPINITSSPLIKVLVREVQRIAKSRVLIFSAIVAPLLSIVIIAQIFSSGVVSKLPVAIVDNDHTALSRKISQQLSILRIADCSMYESTEQAHLQMKQGKCEAIVVIPSNTEKLIYKGRSANVQLYVNNANVVKGGLLYSQLYKTLATLSGGVKLNLELKKGSTHDQAMAKIQPVKMDSHVLFNPYTNYSYFLTLTLLPLMLVILVFLVSVYALGIELKQGTAKEFLDLGNNHVVVALTGKMLPYALLFFGHAMVMNLVLFKVLGTPLQGNLTIVLFAEFLLLVVYQLLAILFLKLTANMRLSLSLGSAYTMMAMTFAGITFPTLAMPILAKVFSWIFPYTFWIRIFIGQTIRNQPLHSAIPDFLVLLVFIIISLLAFPGMKRKLTDPKYWGRS